MKRFQLADVDVQAPKRQAVSAFALAPIFRLRSCRLMGVFIIPPLPPMLLEVLRTAGLLRSTGVTPSQRYYEPLRHPLVVGRLPGAAGYTAYPASALSGRDEEGFSSCSMCPGRRAVANHPAGATRRVNRSATSRAAFTLQLRARPPGRLTFGATARSLALRPEQLAPTPRVGSSRGSRTVGFPPACPPSYGASDCYPDRTDSC